MVFQSQKSLIDKQVKCNVLTAKKFVYAHSNIKHQIASHLKIEENGNCENSNPGPIFLFLYHKIGNNLTKNFKIFNILYIFYDMYIVLLTCITK